MAVDYTSPAIDARLQGVADLIDTGGAGALTIREGTTVLISITLANPCGTASGGVLVFSTPLVNSVGAVATGSADNGRITNGDGTLVVENMSVGIPLSGADIIMSNGLNSTLIQAGQAVALLSATITGN